MTKDTKNCSTLFTDISQPPDKVKTAWKNMIPKWAWEAMVDDTVNVLKAELPQNTPSEHIERRIRNKHVFIRKEAFFPDAFLPDVVVEACRKLKK